MHGGEGKARLIFEGSQRIHVSAIANLIFKNKMELHVLCEISFLEIFSLVQMIANKHCRTKQNSSAIGFGSRAAHLLFLAKFNHIILHLRKQI